MERYEMIEQIGKGSHGEVWRVQTRNGYRALKIAKGEAIENLRAEAELLKSIQHPAIPAFYGFSDEQHQACLMMDWMEGVVLTSLCNRELSEQEILKYGLQILDILDYLHREHILYLDLKLENILLTRDDRIQFVDFSCAQRLDKQNPILHYGTYGFAPPEQYVEGYLDERCDLYAFGRVLMALALGIYDGELLASYRSEDVMRSERFLQLLRGCLQEDREQRFNSCEELRIAIEEGMETASSTHLLAGYMRLGLLIFMGIFLCGFY